MALPDGTAAVIEAVVALFHPHLEAVVHDVAADEVVAVWNPVSGRRPGDASLLEPDLLDARAGVLGPYGKVDAQGRAWTSVTVLLNDGATLLCLNFDRSVLDRAAGALAAFAAPVQPPPAGLFERDWRQEIDQLVDSWCRSCRTPRDLLTAAQRRELVAHLDNKGVFGVRHSARHVAAALGVSRATVYGTLKACRG